MPEAYGRAFRGNPKVAYKGELSLKLKTEVEAGEVHIKAEIDSELRKRPRRSTLFWVTDDGDPELMTSPACTSVTDPVEVEPFAS